MQVNLISCLFVLNSEKNNNIRKNDIKSIKVLVDKDNNLPQLILDSNDMKKQIKKEISSIIGSNIFHLEQVYTMDGNNSIDIIYLGITNIENVTKLKNNYKLIDFKIENNDTIYYDDKKYKYKTIEKNENNNIEYFHQINCNDSIVKRNLMSLLISYKKIRNNADDTDILFKFMGNTFTLEDVRLVYEMIKDTSVDKSNFRKKIIKYCEKVEEKSTEKSGYRPSQKYRFRPLKGDIWI